jgi:hypothetical protein
MAKKTLDACRTGNDFLAYAQQRDAVIRNGKGSHVMISTDAGSVVVPLHTKDLGKGLACKIRKMFLLIGLTLIPLACLIISAL